MSWPVGTIVACLLPRDEWHIHSLGYDAPDIGERCTVAHDDGRWLRLVEYTRGNPLFLRMHFRLAEGGACESERARQMSEVRV